MDSTCHSACCGETHPIPLADLPLLATGCIRGLHAPEAEVDRLKAMGLCIGRKVLLLRRGDPLLIKVFGSRLAVSRVLAAGITVERLDPASCRHLACPGGAV